jgi:hypothetical protein
MSTWQIVLSVCVFVVIDLAVVILVIRSLAASLKDTFGPFPVREIGASGVTKQFQTIRVNSFMNFGGCIHISVDESTLHLRPAWFGRVFGFPAASIPWDQTRLLRQRGALAIISVGNAELQGPAWAFALAPSAPSAGSGAAS